MSTAGTPTADASPAPSAAAVAAASGSARVPTVVTERAADVILQQQERVAELEHQLGAKAPMAADETPTKPISIRHGAPRCATCNTLLHTVSQLETMLQHRDSDCDALRKSLDDAQRVNALLLEQIEMLQRGLQKAITDRQAAPFATPMSVPQSAARHHTPAPVPAAAAATSPSPDPASQHGGAYAVTPYSSASVPTNVRMLQPSAEPTLRAMADAVNSLQSLLLTHPRTSAPAVPPSKLEGSSPSPPAPAAPGGADWSP